MDIKSLVFHTRDGLKLLLLGRTTRSGVARVAKASPLDHYN